MRWWVILAVFFITTNNYLDRIMVNVLSPVILKDLNFTELEFGYVNSAFQFTYALGYLLMGRYVDFAGTRKGYSVAIVLWSLAAGLHATAQRWFDLSLLRAMLGFGEGGNFPAAIKAVSEWFPKRDRAFATGIFNAGTNVGAMVGPPLFVWMNYHFGWRLCFLITASTGFLCLVLWRLIYRLPREHPRANAAEIALIESDPEEPIARKMGWSEVLQFRAAYGFLLAKFFSDPVWWFYLTWLALYFTTVRHMSLKEIGWALPVIYLAADLGSVAGGWISGWFMRRGMPNGRARKLTMAIFAFCMPLAACSVIMPEIWQAVLLISLATASHQGWSANLYTAASDVFPKSAIASVIGMGGFFGSMSAVVFTALLPGWIITHFGYKPIFVMMGAFHPIGWLFIHFLMGKMEPVTEKPR
jgi:ACS family hexuronate transporter-like MFS transporter